MLYYWWDTEQSMPWTNQGIRSTDIFFDKRDQVSVKNTISSRGTDNKDDPAQHINNKQEASRPESSAV